MSDFIASKSFLVCLNWNPFQLNTNCFLFFLYHPIENSILHPDSPLTFHSFTENSWIIEKKMNASSFPSLPFSINFLQMLFGNPISPIFIIGKWLQSHPLKYNNMRQSTQTKKTQKREGIGNWRKQARFTFHSYTFLSSFNIHS